MKQVLLFMLLFFGAIGVGWAQITVTGTVVDIDGNPLPSAVIKVKDQAKGVIADLDGKFTIAVERDAVLIVSYAGFAPTEVAVNGQSVLNVELQPSVAEEVVVIGYGTRKRGDLTGAITSIDNSTITKSTAMTPQLAMQGRMAGVFVSTPGGDPNARPEVLIRGVGTIGFNDPLYVIDGVPVTEFGSGSVYTVSPEAAGDLRGTQNVFNLINPNDIESISVLKDASAAAIYGVRAANGVVLITTKRGSQGKPSVRFSGSRGFQQPLGRFDMLNTAEYTALHQEMFRNNPNELPNMPAQFNPDSSKYLGNAPTYDWQDEAILRNALTEDYSVNISGGNLGSNFSVSAGYASQQAPLKYVSQDRYTLSIASDFRINKWLEIGETYRLAFIDAIDERNSGGNPLDLGVAYAPPWQPVFDPNGPGGYAASRILDPATNSVVDAQPYGPETDFNLFGIREFNATSFTQLRNLGSTYLQIQPISGLRIRGTISIDWFLTRRLDWQDQRIANFRDYDLTQGNQYGERNTQNYNFTKEFSINYNKNFGDHFVDVLFNAMDQQYGVFGLNAGAINVPRTEPLFRGIIEGRDNTVAANIREPHALQGYLGRLSYAYKNKYYLDATVRRDGTSRFAPDYRWGTFPAVALAWRISEESFLKGATWLNDLKLRGGWGKLGNQETRPYAFLSLLNGNPRYPLGRTETGAGTPTQGFFLPDFPVIDLSWEVATTTSAGFDAALFNNKLTLTVEYYNRLTSGILQVVQIPAVVGAVNQPVFNIAEVRNQGMEAVLGYNFNIGPVQFSASGNITTVQNRVMKLAGGTAIGGEFNRIEEGFPLNYLWGLQQVGIFQSQSEVDAFVATYNDPGFMAQKSPGDIQFADLYGSPTEPGQFRSDVPDSVVNALDRTYLGKRIPGYFYGVTLNAFFKGFDLSVLFQGIGDVQKVNDARWRGEGMLSQGVNQWTTVRERWTPDNPSTTMPRAVRSDPSGNTRFSDRWVENAGFLRLRNLQLGYSLPASALSALNAREIRIFLTGSNLLTFTPWTGIDPENDYNPPARSFLIGANLAF
jgi:TonB-linked SusC/RagA family outer membrane protein